MKHRGFLLAEICEVLDCAVHHIRYIEEQLPIISTAYDTRGRRIYSLKDVFLFSRILSMTRSRGMGLQHALDTLIRDLDRPSIDTTARFLQIRHELIKNPAAERSGR
jgi:DNA-binding transcriptional MerR regulator